jgi:fructose-bisphosphate aldolase, class II
LHEIGQNQYKSRITQEEKKMPLVTANDVLIPARASGYAVGAFNCINLEFVQACIAAAELENSPVMIATTTGALKYASWVGFPAAIRAMAQASSVPVVLHLDHGLKLEEVERALKAGFSSIMIDASHLSFEENVKLTKQAADLAHQYNVSLEAEIGQIGGKEDDIVADEALTDPGVVAEFVRLTGLDILAPAFGSAHQKTRGEISLVLHGGSGVPFEAMRQVIARGVAKVNLGTELQKTFSSKLRETIQADSSEWDGRKLFKPSIETLTNVMRDRMKTIGSSGKGGAE